MFEKMTVEEKRASMSKIEAEVLAGLETDMVEFCTQQGITAGWSVDNHSRFQLGLAMDVVESGLDADETRFRLHVQFRALANYSAWRQAHERDEKHPNRPLAAGTGRGTRSLVGEY